MPWQNLRSATNADGIESLHRVAVFATCLLTRLTSVSLYNALPTERDSASSRQLLSGSLKTSQARITHRLSWRTSNKANGSTGYHAFNVTLKNPSDHLQGLRCRASPSVIEPRSQFLLAGSVSPNLQHVKLDLTTRISSMTCTDCSPYSKRSICGCISCS
ncbi:uncharacterized protein LAESUDRAFT_307374 [Laetiporus sulphureus 93-53]|uniref:Uncharacterized protein n=1 Tax=Laetiporus sulphureus 93-53 TaxID=1314785 RepID=A0A165D9G1_9APHY|nr:uncharacterized protein LAESUDRAFT_307374 [Laetiporus sulphureus 93-53]KZT04381.1 hypothetical protein LAESUDRAFT_307374 [Laetiporus sulphureus 93-53]